jgi:MFS family permease
VSPVSKCQFFTHHELFCVCVGDLLIVFVATPGIMDIQLGDSSTLSLAKIHQYGSTFTLIMSCGIFAISVVGLLMDRVGYPVTSFVITTFGILWALCVMSGSEQALVPSFIFYAIYRTFLFTFLFAYLADALGFKYFGVMAGLMFVAGGVASLFQYPLGEWAAGSCHVENTLQCDKGHWFIVNTTMLLTMLLSYSFTYYDWLRRRQGIRRAGSSRSFIAKKNGDIIDAQANVSLLASNPQGNYGSVSI